MTLMSHFFIATQKEINTVEDSSGPPLSLPHVLEKGVDVDKIRQLHDLIIGKRTVDELNAEDAPLMWLDDSDLPCVMQPCPQLIADLAGAPGAQLHKWAAAWASLKAWNSGDAPNSVVTFTISLAALALKATVSGRMMYCWFSKWPDEPEADDQTAESEKEK